jgi:hypothetical protein
MILLNFHERQVYANLSRQDYLSFKAELESTYNKPFLVALLESMEGICNYYRSEDSGTPRSFFERKISKDKACYNIAIALEAIKAVIPTATFEDAKCVAMGYVPDVYRDPYGYQRVTNGKEDKSPLIKIRVGDYAYHSLSLLEGSFKASLANDRDLDELGDYRKLKLALFYGLIKREELSEYLDNLIYGQVVQQKENEIC